MYVDDSYELYQRLSSLNLLQESPPFWWPNYGSFEVVLGVILTQNSQWRRVECSLENLRSQSLCTLESIQTCPMELLSDAIRPSGLHHTKAVYIKTLTDNIVANFGDFENFCHEVTREWLLQQQGIGNESADAILCYACRRSEMVVDRYTHRLLVALGYEFESYDALKEWCEQLHVNVDATTLPQVYAEFHGMIVEYMKKHVNRQKTNIIF